MKKTMLILLSLCAFALMATGAFADEQKPSKAMPATKTTEHKAEAMKPADMSKHAGHMMVANEVAVCACGKVFHPDATTKYITYEGKSYAVCSDDCHKKGEQDPAAISKAADDNAKKLMAANATPKS